MVHASGWCRRPPKDKLLKNLSERQANAIEHAARGSVRIRLRIGVIRIAVAELSSHHLEMEHIAGRDY
jgi:hypothetical protein